VRNNNEKGGGEKNGAGKVVKKDEKDKAIGGERIGVRERARQ
jgi:hypothetical protein